MEWQTRACLVDGASLAHKFRRYFDRFEGRIREPPFAVYDDLAYTQGTPPERLQSPHTGEVGGSGSVEGMDGYREGLRSFAHGLGKEDDAIQDIFTTGELQQAVDFEDLYNFPILLEQQQSQAGNYANAMEDPGLSNLDPFTVPELGYQTNTATTQIFGGAEVRNSSTLSLFPSATTTADAIQDSEIYDFTFDEGDIILDLFDDLPGLDRVTDQWFLEFLDTQQ